MTRCREERDTFVMGRSLLSSWTALSQPVPVVPTGAMSQVTLTMLPRAPDLPALAQPLPYPLRPTRNRVGGPRGPHSHC